MRLAPLPAPCPHANLQTYFIWLCTPAEDVEVRYACRRCGLSGHVQLPIAKLAPSYPTMDDYFENRERARAQAIGTVRALLVAIPFDFIVGKGPGN